MPRKVHCHSCFAPTELQNEYKWATVSPSLLVLPYLNSAIFGTCRDAPTVGTPVECVDFVGVSRQGFPSLLALRYFPQFGRTVLAGRHKVTAVAAPRYLVDRPNVAGQGDQEVARESVPDFDLLVKRGTSKVTTVGRKRQVVDGLLVPGQAFDRLL